MQQYTQNTNYPPQILLETTTSDFTALILHSQILFTSSYISLPRKKNLDEKVMSHPTLKVALIGQSVFGQEVYKALRKDGHDIVGVFTIPDKNGRPDPLAVEAEKDGARVFKFPRWRQKDTPIIPDVFDQYKACGAQLNVLAFCSQVCKCLVLISYVHRLLSVVNGSMSYSIIVFWSCCYSLVYYVLKGCLSIFAALRCNVMMIHRLH